MIVRPHDLKDSFYITGVLRTDLMLKYMYSKTRWATPGRYRLSEEDFQVLDFPKEGKEIRKARAKSFEASLDIYHKTLEEAEKKLIGSHHKLETDL